VILGVKAAFEAVFNFIAEKIEWLMEQGRKISEFADRFLNGDTQFQTDQAVAGTAEALRLKRRREMQAAGLTNEAALERFGLGRNTAVGIDKVVQDSGIQVRQMADTGIDEIHQAPMLSLVDKIPKVDRGPSITDFVSRSMLPQVNVAAPQMRLEVNISGRTDGEDLSETIVSRMQEFWDTSMRDAQVTAGGRGGRLP
jgi:hypothetical protein